MRLPFLLLLPSLLAAATPSNPPRPNVIVIMSDDMGYSDLGSYGGEIPTPNLDALPAGGLRFTQLYNGDPRRPTPGSLLTGLFPLQAGIGPMVADPGTPSHPGEPSRCGVTSRGAGRPGGSAT